MKKASLLLCILLVLALLLTACDPGVFGLRPEEFGGIESVSLIRCSDPRHRELSFPFFREHRLASYIEEYEEVLETLDSERTEEFAERMGETYEFVRFPWENLPDGVCLRLDFLGGDFAVASGRQMVLYSSDGKVKEYLSDFDEEDILALADEFFETELN